MLMREFLLAPQVVSKPRRERKKTKCHDLDWNPRTGVAVVLNGSHVWADPRLARLTRFRHCTQDKATACSATFASDFRAPHPQAHTCHFKRNRHEMPVSCVCGAVETLSAYAPQKGNITYASRLWSSSFRLLFVRHGQASHFFLPLSLSSLRLRQVAPRPPLLSHRRSTHTRSVLLPPRESKGDEMTLVHIHRSSISQKTKEAPRQSASSRSDVLPSPQFMCSKSLFARPWAARRLPCVPGLRRRGWHGAVQIRRKSLIVTSSVTLSVHQER